MYLKESWHSGKIRHWLDIANDLSSLGLWKLAKIEALRIRCRGLWISGSMTE